MTPLFGQTRSVVRRNHALIEPAGFVASPAPEWKNAKAYIVISPAMGAKFTQTHLRLEKAGSGKGRTRTDQFVAYVNSGGGSANIGGVTDQLKVGSYLYVPPGTAWSIKAERGTELVIFTKRYVHQDGAAVPAPIIGHASKVSGQAFLGDPDARLQVLLPDIAEFDMAVNIFTYQPGATLPFVETHIMEHGLLMLSGSGVYRLHDEWLPVREGDVIWMGPYCPQWFVAMGKAPASYLYYKDVNRAPVLP